jgi:glyoxylase-like metal-dependent hydrolase (beta-lactamase superfamily II)
MGKQIWVAWAAVILSGCAKPQAITALNSAADAVGGKDKILAVSTLTIEGEGTNPNLGQNLTPDAPLPVWKITGFEQTIDPGMGRMRLQQELTAQFPYGLATTVRQTRGLDRDVAWDDDEDGNAIRLTERAALERRIELLHHPITILYAAFDQTAKVTNYRERDNLELVDVTTANGDTVTLGIDKTTKLPASVTSRTDQPNLGDVAIETLFSDYEVVGGLKLPRHLVTKIDKWARSDIRVSKNTLNAPADLAASGPLRAQLPAPANPPISITVEQVAPGIWWLDGDGNYHSVVFEFSDHLTLFEVPLSENRAKAVIEKARSLAFGKPLTEVIVSHHHLDHSAGVRTAVAEGLTIITQRGNLAFFKDLITRPHTILPDELAMSLAAPQLTIKAVDDELVLKDDSMELDLYHVKNNSHADTLLMGWVPRDHILVQADLYDSGWRHFPWADNLRENLELRKLSPEKDVPIHGKIESYADVLKTMAAKK